MIDQGVYSVLGVNVHAVDYDRVLQVVLAAAAQRRPFSLSALAVHGVMTGATDAEHARRLNGLDMVVPDGQPVRWALALLHGQRLPDRVYGPELTLRVLRGLAAAGLSVYLYGSTPEVLNRFIANIRHDLPTLKIAGSEASKFRRTTPEEQLEIAEHIRDSGANLVLVGLGCPRQEVWAFEYRDLIGVPLLAVGAAFDFHAGTLAQAPKSMQASGLEWLFRLTQEPKRLWRRYVLLNPMFLGWLALQKTGLRPFPARAPNGTETPQRFG
ncbi:WecB/TagA/CpsF family glycosyltransferase [Deinococcus ruber]|uniref:UDP-N-acetyl-D-mannosaminuronic acid transferase n=1 Tax=Deinococcus ruber TaxID=1848197 RepID=A0A918C5V6_9DEIO|nr:WecB/TagA/CpsF family glycosyltransferase [Deinococcus ruber]GGR06735.1 UDP-N-acetyl-D-mannosaminuronic acid transferase [Deinococcus ruber]